MHLTRKGFNFLMLIWLVPAIGMSIYGNTTATGVTSDLYFWATGVFVALGAFALLQMFREEFQETSKGINHRGDDMVTLDVGTFEYIYCAILCVAAIASFFYHHAVNKDSQGLVSILTLIWSYFDWVVAGLSGWQFWHLKSAEVTKVAKTLVSR